MASSATQVHNGTPPGAASAPNFWTSAKACVACLALLEFTLLLFTASRYGYFVDELYFLGCSEHLSLGYIDQPPVIVLLTWFARYAMGGSLLALRVLPAFAAATLVWFSAAIARELGGKRFAQVLAAAGVVATPMYLQLHHQLVIDAFQPLLWTGCAYCAILAVKQDRPHFWILCGTIAGIGLEEKYTIALLLVGLALGGACFAAKKSVMTVQFWVGAGVAFLIFLPNFWWQYSHNFPFLQWQAAIRENAHIQTFNFSLSNFLHDQLMYTLPSFPLWILGFWFLLFSRQGKAARFLGLALALAYVVLVKAGGKSIYTDTEVAILIAAGSVCFEQLLAGMPQRWVRPAIVGAVLALGAMLAPCFVPILPVERMLRYQAALHLPLPVYKEAYERQSKMPPNLAWEFGWDEIVQATASLYHSLPTDEQKKAGIVASSYGPAGAIDFMGGEYGLPKAVSPQLAYHDFGPRNYTGDVLIMVGYDRKALEFLCKTVQPGPDIKNRYGYDGQRGPIINICRGLRFDLQRDWAGFQHY